MSYSEERYCIDTDGFILPIFNNDKCINEDDIKINNSEFEYIIETNVSKRLSKLDEFRNVSAWGADPKNYDSLRQAYKQICAEIVCETNTLGKTHFITEKTLRPMLNGCIPLTIANAGHESYLKSLGFDIFDDVLDKSYDTCTGTIRIEKVYTVLDRILKNEQWLKLLNTRLQNNILKVQNYIQENTV